MEKNYLGYLLSRSHPVSCFLSPPYQELYWRGEEAGESMLDFAAASQCFFAVPKAHAFWNDLQRGQLTRIGRPPSDCMRLRFPRFVYGRSVAPTQSARVIEALGRIGGTEAEAYLEMTAGGHEVPEVRRISAAALARLRGREPVRDSL